METQTDEVQDYLNSLPALTEDEYEDLLSLKARVAELKNMRSDAFDAIDNAKAQLELMQNQFESIQHSVRNTGQQFEMKFRELMAKYGVQGGNISIADTPPHYITTFESQNM
jgi:CHASE3 domain sensor protein